jgi:hypothetical protein
MSTDYQTGAVPVLKAKATGETDEDRPAAPHFKLYAPQWTCPIHGAIGGDLVLSFVYPHGARTYCLLCCLQLLERLGLRELERG